MTLLDLSTLLQVVVPVASAGVTGGAAFGVLRRARAGDAYTGLGRAFAGVAVSAAVVAMAYALLGSLIEESGRLVIVSAFVVAGPWLLYAVRYIGRGHILTRQRVALGGGVFLVTICLHLWLLFPSLLDSSLSTEMFELVFAFLGLSVLSAVLGTAGLTVISAYRHGQLPTAGGVVAAAPVVVMVLAAQLVSADTQSLNQVVAAVAFVVVAAVCVVGPRRYGLVDDPPGVRRRGRRVGLADTDAAVFIVDADNRVVDANDAARVTFGGADRLPEGVGVDFETLADRETVSCWTQTGRRRFDPRVTRVRDGFGETLGATVALIDVTDREIRRQRLEVLNRVLRHNVRNQLDVIAAHAETAELPAVVDSVDRIRRLSAEARRVESLVGRDRSAATPTDMAVFVERVVVDVLPERADSVTVDVPSVTIEIDRKLCRYALSELLENAVEHGSDEPTVVVRGSETATGSRLVVADDGPGIPANERAVIDAESETPLSHGSSLGLWGVQWAVQTLGGSLSFNESDLGGTAVTLELPDRGAVSTANGRAATTDDGSPSETPHTQESQRRTHGDTDHPPADDAEPQTSTEG